MVLVRNYIIIILRWVINTLCSAFKVKFRLEFVWLKILEKNYPTNSSFSFIQVGANDGVSHDNLYQFVAQRQPSGIVIEPLNDFYCELAKNYEKFPNVKPIKKAIHSFEHEVIIYHVEKKHFPSLPDWAKGIGSVLQDHYKKSKISEQYITQTKVEAERLSNIIEANYHNSAVDLLQVDVEGYDYEVLKTFDFEKLAPKMIRVEYINLSDIDKKGLYTTLQDRGYFAFEQYPDLVAIKLRHLKL